MTSYQNKHEAEGNRPTLRYPPDDWEHREVYQGVHRAIKALPNFFESELFITGVPVTDLYTFNTPLSAAIEAQVVQTLNSKELREVWDGKGIYAEYKFLRQTQRFPDVILQKISSEDPTSIIMGLELKGWYVLSKEGEPSFRYKVTPQVCAIADLLVVIPWMFSHVITGSPQIFDPYVISARFAAEYRNWHWQFEKREQSSGGITIASATDYYPEAKRAISDSPISDKGNNFGRFARTGLMDEYNAQLFQQHISGIPIEAWLRFFKIFVEARDERTVRSRLEHLVKSYQNQDTFFSKEDREAIERHLIALADILEKAT